MIMTAVSGMIGYVAHGRIDLIIGGIIGAAAAIGGGSSSYVANKIGDNALSKIVGLVFILVALIIGFIEIISL